MAYYQIKDIGKVGVVTDLSPTDLPPNAFTDALNARFIGGQITKFGGNKPITYFGPEDNKVAYAIQPMPFDFQYDHPFNILGTKDGLYLLEDQHWENISYWEPLTGGLKKATVAVTSHPLMTGIRFTENQVNVKSKKSHDFYVELIPDNVKKQDLVWNLVNPSVGTLVVDSNDPKHAVFTASNASTGQSLITVTNQEGTLNDFVSVNIVPDTDQLSINRDTFNVRRSTDASTYPTATVSFIPPQAAGSTPLRVKWISSDITVFTLDETVDPNNNYSVKLVPGRVGSADLTVQLVDNPGIKGRARVNVTAGVTSVSIVTDPANPVGTAKNSIILDRSDPQTDLYVVINPAGAPTKTFSWSIINDDFSSEVHQDGLNKNHFTVKPLRAGKSVLQIVADDGGVIGMCQIVIGDKGVPAPAPTPFRQSDDPGDVLSFSVDLSNIVSDEPLFDYPPMAPPPPVQYVDPKPSDGSLHFKTDLEDKVQFPLRDKNNILKVEVEGGTAPYTYQWFANGVLASQTSNIVDLTGFGSELVQDRQVVVTDSTGLKIASEVCTMYIYDPNKDQYIVKLEVDKTVVDFNQGDKETITAKVKTNDGNYDNLIYFWNIKKDGVVTHDELDEDKLTIYGLGGGNTTIELEVWPTRQKVFNINPANNWYHTTIANCAVFNTNNHQPMVKEFDKKMFRILPGWGEQTIVDDDGNWSVEKTLWRTERVRAFNNRLFALNMWEPDSGGVERHYPQRLRWSNFATENKAPTLWDDLADLRDPDDSNSAEGTLKALVNGYAGYIDLADTQGDLMDMLPLKDYLFVYTEFETYVGTPTMNAYQPMTFKKLFNDSGILAPGCAVEVEGGQFVVTQNDIILHNGATKQSIANTIVKERVIQEISAVNPAATRVYLHQDKKEVWVCYVGKGHPKNTWYNSKAAVWNYEFQTWTFYELPHTYEIALVDPPQLDKTATWADFVAGGKMDFTWDSITPKKMPWQKNFLNFRKRITVGCSAMKGLYQMDIGQYNWAATNYQDPTTMTPNERPLKMWAERQGIDFDSVTEEWRQKHINNFRFQVNGQGTLSIDVGGTQYSNEKGHQHNYREYIAGRTRNLSVRLNHPYLYYGIIDEDPKSTVSINGLVIDFALGGRR